MNYGYFIVYDTDDCAHYHFKIVHGFNTIAAIHSFYSEFTQWESASKIDDEMFYKAIQHMSVEDAIKFHNLLVPNYPITQIYDISKVVYDENSTEASE